MILQYKLHLSKPKHSNKYVRYDMIGTLVNYVDDGTYSFVSMDPVTLSNILTSKYKIISNYMESNILLNDKKSQINLQYLNLKIWDKLIEQVVTNCKEKYFKFVGHVLDDTFTWAGHVEHICKKLATLQKTFLPL